MCKRADNFHAISVQKRMLVHLGTAVALNNDNIRNDVAVETAAKWWRLVADNNVAKAQGSESIPIEDYRGSGSHVLPILLKVGMDAFSL